MPYFDFAIDSPHYHSNLSCPVASCKRGISHKNPAMECGNCNRLFHPSCKGIIGAAKIKKACDSNWTCSPDCVKPVNRIAEQTPSENTSSEEISCTNSSSCSIAIKSMVNRFDADFKELKNMFVDIMNSQDFICNEFERLKSDYKRISDENSALTEKCHKLESQHQMQEERITRLEYGIDALRQSELSSNLLIAGFPDNSIAPSLLAVNVLKSIECDDAIPEIAVAEYMVAHTNIRSKTSPVDYKLLIKFKNLATKHRVFQQKKKLKMKLFAADVGFQGINKQIYFRDHLTPFRNSLYREARHLKLTHNFKYLWINNGNILFRKSEGSKAIIIQTRADFSKITGVDPPQSTL